MRVLGINAVFHDPAAALVVGGRIVAAAEEERFSRRKHGKLCVPFSTWELPEEAARWCLKYGNVEPSELDAIAYSYDPNLAPPDGPSLSDNEFEALRTYFVRRAPGFAATALPGFDRSKFRFVPHHVAHAASAYLAGPYRDCAVIVMDGRGESTSYLAGIARGGELEVLRRVALPHSLGLRYEELTVHLGFMRSSDEYKVMALASYGRPRYVDEMRHAMHHDGNGGFVARPIDFSRFVPQRPAGEAFEDAHADLAASVQTALQETILELAVWLHECTGANALVLAGGVALNVVANSYVAERGPFENVWVQPAAGDAGTALGAALYVARSMGDDVRPMRTAALGREWSDDEIEAQLAIANVKYSRPADIARAAADVIARDGIVAWFQGRSEFGPRALGHRSLLANPRRSDTLRRLNDVKGREQFRPVAPMTLLERAREMFEGPFPSPYMLFVHGVKPAWKDALQAVVHVDGTARVQTIDRSEQPLAARLLDEVARLTGVPVVVNTSLNTAGRPMVDSPRDALECFGSAPIDALAIGPFLLERSPRSAKVDGAHAAGAEAAGRRANGARIYA
jgi:carbamoyltransferase